MQRPLLTVAMNRPKNAARHRAGQVALSRLVMQPWSFTAGEMFGILRDVMKLSHVLGEVWEPGPQLGLSEACQ